MIRPLRVRHRRTFAVLALLLPIGFVAALMARPEYPLSETSPGQLVVSRAGESFLESQPPELQAPDVLVYLVPGDFTGETLPAEAVLLGSFAATRSRLWLPDDLEEGLHTLVYYSLGHGKVVFQRQL